MIFAVAAAVAIITWIVLYAHHKHLSAIAEVKGIVTSLRSGNEPAVVKPTATSVA